jgi:hypothetical protein
MAVFVILRGKLLTETRLYRDAFASLGPAARKYFGSAFRLHASPEAVFFRALAPVGLKCAFGHEKSVLLIESTGLRQGKSINEGERERQRERTERYSFSAARILS